MTPHILLFGGTTQGKELSAKLSKLGINHYYSTKTATNQHAEQYCTYLSGAKRAGEIAQFCKEKHITILLDASHPFAKNLHDEISIAAQWTQLPLVRYEREQLDKISNPLVFYCTDFREVINRIEEAGHTRILATTGVNTISELKSLYKNPSITLWHRVLNRQSSIDQALELGIVREQILPADAPQSAAQELLLIRSLDIDAVISKDSGITGGLQFKISACLAEEIPIYIVKRPLIPDNYICFSEIDNLLKFLIATVLNN